MRIKLDNLIIELHPSEVKKLGVSSNSVNILSHEGRKIRIESRREIIPNKETTAHIAQRYTSDNHISLNAPPIMQRENSYPIQSDNMQRCKIDPKNNERTPRKPQKMKKHPHNKETN